MGRSLIKQDYQCIQAVPRTIERAQKRDGHWLLSETQGLPFCLRSGALILLRMALQIGSSSLKQLQKTVAFPRQRDLWRNQPDLAPILKKRDDFSLCNAEVKVVQVGA